MIYQNNESYYTWEKEFLKDGSRVRKWNAVSELEGEDIEGNKQED